MCGIFGCAPRTPLTEKILPFLAWEMVERGRDSWGVTDGENIVKKLGPITDGTFEIPEWDFLVYHTRAASVGAKTIANQHPFVFEQKDTDGSVFGKVVGVHNGCVYNHDELDRKYDRKFDVDSMHIFAHIAEGKDTKEINGWGALVWFEDTQLNFCRFNMTDLHIVQLETGEILWCSTFAPLTQAIRFAGGKIKTDFTLQNERRYFIGYDNDVLTLYEGEKMVFGSRYKTTSSYTYSDSNRRWCGICKSMVCVHNGDSAYPWDDADINGWFARRTREIEDSRKDVGKNDIVIHTPSSTPPAEVGKTDRPFGAGSTTPSFNSMVGEVLTKAKNTGRNDSPTSSIATKGINPHVGTHSQRDGKCAVTHCTHKVTHPKSQLVCPKCYTMFDQRMKTVGMPLIVW